MLRNLCSLVFGQPHKVKSSHRTHMEEHEELTMPFATPASQPCFFLEKLPPELRVRVYDYLLVFPQRLVPHVSQKSTKTASALSSRRRRDDLATAHPAVDITVFILNKQIYEEAADVFYSRNKFCVHFDYFCTCWNTRYALRLNEERIKHFKVLGVNLDHEDPMLWDRCKMCSTDGFGLLKYVNSLPNLRSVAIAFANEESFASCAGTAGRKLRKLAKTASLEASNIGRLQITGTKALIELRLPSLIRSWPEASKRATSRLIIDISDDEDDASVYGLSELRGVNIGVYTALRDILYHTFAFRETTRELQVLMQKAISSRGVQIERLSASDQAAFTVALAESEFFLHNYA